MIFVNSSLDSSNCYLDMVVRLAPAACSWPSDPYSANNSHNNSCCMADYWQKTSITFQAVDTSASSPFLEKSRLLLFLELGFLFFVLFVFAYLSIVVFADAFLELIHL